MNAWKITWETFFKHSTRRSYAKELWRLSSIKLRVGLVVSALSFIVAITWVSKGRTDDWKSMAAILLTELFLLLVIEEMKGRVFKSEYGDNSTALAPPEKEHYRESRFLMFKKKLKDSSVTRDHVKDLFDLVEAKIEIENHRYEMVKKFLIFASGVVTASIVAWMRGLDSSAAIQSAAWFVVFCAIVAPFLWVLPSRKERLKELKYFMLLYAKGNDP